MFTVIYLKFRLPFYQLCKTKQTLTLKPTAFMLKIKCLEFLEGCKKKHLFYKIIHFSMQFSAVYRFTLVNVYVDLVVFTHIAGTS